ncbi:molybdate ABC transporter substrate-binding protein [Oricola indica]|uniref:molybdate ABC transporter substrate-binding protein n=1 Tax=Oricola indica TaxID=2872591 RepID=UPI001CBAB90D|nr:molybdate ABC transporter substrate-binding protein [Oricola indica]
MNALIRLRLGAAFLLTLVTLTAAPANAADIDCGDAPLIVFAAASMTDAINEFTEAFQDDTGCAVTVSVAGSSTLARQIAEGAPAGLYISANRDWVTWLAENAPERIASEPAIIARNGLVAVSKSTDSADIADLLSSRFAMADPGHVPAGIYGKAALESLGIWADVSSNAAFTENVRVALAMAARGDVGAAIVYATDARMEPDLKIAYRFDPASHPEIAYEAVLLSGGGNLGKAFLDRLNGKPGQEVLAKYGFLAGGYGGQG